MPFLAFADDSVVIDYGVEVRDGSVSIRIRRYVWDIVPERIWGEQVRDSAAGQFNVSLPARGIYCLELSYVAFEGSVRVDWDVR